MALTAMEEAFKKSGLVSKTEIEKNRENEVLELKRKENQKNKERHVEQQRQYNELTKKFKPFDIIWDDFNKKKFLTHLIFAYTPFDAAYYPLSNEELKEKKCCICKHDLISKQFIFDNKDKLVDSGLERMKRIVKGETINLRQEFEKDFGNVRMAVVSESSSAAFCAPCFTDFYEWIEHMLLRGNRQINQIITRRRLECSLTSDELKEHDLILREKDNTVRAQKMEEFFVRIKKANNSIES